MKSFVLALAFAASMAHAAPVVASDRGPVANIGGQSWKRGEGATVAADRGPVTNIGGQSW